MTVRLHTDGAVAIMTIDRPAALNALDLTALKELRAHLTEFRERDDLRVAVLTGAGERAFCAGADLKGTAQSAASYPEGLFKSTDTSAEVGLYVRLMDLTGLEIAKPIVAAVNGHCLGAGLEIALQCDVRVASRNASFGLPEVRVGSIPAVSGLHRLLKAVAPAHAMKMVLTGDKIDAATARTIGLVSDVCEPGDLESLTLGLAHRIAANAPLAIQAVKRLARQTAHLSDVDAQHLTELYWGVLRDTQDRIEGRAAFADKRPPVFSGR